MPSESVALGGAGQLNQKYAGEAPVGSSVRPLNAFTAAAVMTKQWGLVVCRDVPQRMSQRAASGEGYERVPSGVTFLNHVAEVI